MAIKLKAKPKQKSRVVIKSIDEKHYGPEPVVVTDTTHALNWYNYMYDHEKARDWLLEHMKKSGFEKAQIEAVKRCSKYKIPTTIGWQARMMMNGNTLSESSMNFFNQQLDLLFAEGERVKQEEVEDTAKPVDIQARVRDKANAIITNIEEELDLVMDGKEFSMYTFCQANELNPQILNIVTDHYRPQLEEILSNDEQVNEAYGKRQKFWTNFWNNFFADIDRYLNNKKVVKVRKPREKKAKSAVDLVKNLKYQKEEPSLKIVSAHPAEIIGCQQLWVYNTKYRKLIQYLAVGPAGIQVKGTTLTGWDVESSMSKTLRKPEESLTELLSAGRVGLRSFMSNIKTSESQPNGRINQECILLRIIK
jgi:hypothetical protein